jgi:hypothetical protein
MRNYAREAEKHFKEGLKLNQYSPLCLGWLGFIGCNMKEPPQYADSIKNFNRAIEIVEQCLNQAANSGSINSNIGPDLKKLLLIDYEWNSYNRRILYNHRGQCYSNWAYAADKFDPTTGNNVNSEVNQSVESVSKYWENALADFSEALNIEIDSNEDNIDDYYYNLAETYYHRSKGKCKLPQDQEKALQIINTHLKATQDTNELKAKVERAMKSQSKNNETNHLQTLFAQDASNNDNSNDYAHGDKKSSEQLRDELELKSDRCAPSKRKCAPSEEESNERNSINPATSNKRANNSNHHNNTIAAYTCHSNHQFSSSELNDFSDWPWSSSKCFAWLVEGKFRIAAEQVQCIIDCDIPGDVMFEISNNDWQEQLKQVAKDNHTQYQPLQLAKLKAALNQLKQLATNATQ